MQTLTAYGDHLRAMATACALLMAGLVISLTPLAAQPPTSHPGTGGTKYLIAFPDTTANRIDRQRYPNTRVAGEASILIYSAVNNKVRITCGDGSTVIIEILAGEFRVHKMSPISIMTVNNSPVQAACRVESEWPVIIYCYFASTQGLEAWTPLPVAAWGTRYRAAAIPGDVVRDFRSVSGTEVQTVRKGAPAEITVIAAYDNTTVTFTRPIGLMFEGNPPNVVVLNAGDVYQVQSGVDTSSDADPTRQDDLATTVISSDKPVGVISGNTRAQVNYEELAVLGNAPKNLMIEWLTPSDLYGRDFVYLPTWDEHRAGLGAPAERSREFVRVYNDRNVRMDGYYFQPGGASKVSFNVRRDSLVELSLGAPVAIAIHTDEPTQAVMHSSSIILNNPCTPTPCGSDSLWAPYMVDLASRDRWTSFAPYYAPANPGGMKHYINVVADTNSAKKIFTEQGIAFNFSRKIPGTDLIWGTMPVFPAANHWLVGNDGAKFWGFVYGLMTGEEKFTPNNYIEYNAVSYGYPLVSSTFLSRPHDSLRIDTSYLCNGWLTIVIQALNAEPAGVRDIEFEGTPVNARIVYINPVDPGAVPGRSRIEMRVEPVDPMKDASGVVVIRDRTGYERRVYYNYVAEVVTLSQTSVDFGATSTRVELVRTVKAYNRLTHPVTMRAIVLALGNQGYTITGTSPSGPAEQPPRDVAIAPGDSMTITIAHKPSTLSANPIDTLKVSTPCLELHVPLAVRMEEPRIYVTDINFGSMKTGSAPRTMRLHVCNIGNGILIFDNPGGGALVEWSDGSFTVDAASMARLAGAKLARNECDTIMVTFTPPGTQALHQTTARFHANVTLQRDTSNWTATVYDPPLAVPGEAGSANDLEAGAIGSTIIIRSTLAAPAAMRLEIYDALGTLVALVAEGEHQGGREVFAWDGAGHPNGVYYCRMSAGSWSRTVPVTLKR